MIDTRGIMKRQNGASTQQSLVRTTIASGVVGHSGSIRGGGTSDAHVVGVLGTWRHIVVGAHDVPDNYRSPPTTLHV